MACGIGGEFLAALHFLTRLPVPRREVTLEEVGRAGWAFPAVGALIGLLLVGAAWGLGRVFPAPPTAALVLAFWVAITGALHLDGFVDCCDALVAARSPEERLEILRDVHVGAFGVIGAGVLLVAKFAALAALPAGGWPALLLAPTLGRWAMVYAVVRYPYARPSGLGTALKAQTGPRGLLAATGIALAVVLGVGRLYGLAAFAGAWLFTVLFARWVLGRIPGLTGDVYGALCELTETLILLVFTTGRG